MNISKKARFKILAQVERAMPKDGRKRKLVTKPSVAGSSTIRTWGQWWSFFSRLRSRSVKAIVVQSIDSHEVMEIGSGNWATRWEKAPWPPHLPYVEFVEPE